MKLTDREQRMLQGEDGPAVAAAMDLLVRYGALSRSVTSASPPGKKAIGTQA